MHEEHQHRCPLGCRSLTTDAGCGCGFDQRQRLEQRIIGKVCPSCIYVSVEYDETHRHYVVRHKPDCQEKRLVGVYGA